MNITDDEIEIINSMYENLEVNIPTEEIVWEVDHEKNQGIDSQVSTYTYVVDIALVRGTATEINGVSNFETAISSLYTNGNVNYDFVDDGHISFTIPGMKKTYLNAELCIDMIPQGITNYDGYLFLTAYCGAKEHNSVIFVFDSTTKKFITTMMMSECIHAGGITYANGYLWICDTYIDPETNEKKGKLYYYNYSHIKEALEKIVENNSVSTNTKITSVAMRFFDKGSVVLGNGDIASFITTYAGYLVVGEFMENQDYTGKLNAYVPTDLLNGEVYNEWEMATLPRNAQSALFYVEGSQTYLMINSSYGRNNTSWVHVYKRNSNTFAIKKQITMPPMVEGATLCTGYVYFIYESCGRKYRDGIQYTSNDSASVANIVIGRAIGFTPTFIFK